jgi:prepilin-type processing-associated H-X9-DG protein
MAIQIYLSDYDRFPPAIESNPTALAYMNGSGGPNKGDGGGAGDSGRSRWNGNVHDGKDCGAAGWVNPYLEWPVILDEYIKSRDVWRCPSAKLISGASFIYSDPDWLRELQTHPGQWGSAAGIGPCSQAWPNGWGGTVTDSILQQQDASSNNTQSVSGAFVQNIACNVYNIEGRSTSIINDPSNYVVCGDGGPFTTAMPLGLVAYPDICNLECANCACGGGDPGGGDPCASHHADGSGNLLRDVSSRQPYTRHLGGSNLGYADGHAKWQSAESIIADYASGRLSNIDRWGPPDYWCSSLAEWNSGSGNQPVLCVPDWFPKN